MCIRDRGFFEDLTGSTNGGLLFFAACFVVAAIMVVVYRDPAAPAPSSSPRLRALEEEKVLDD